MVRHRDVELLAHRPERLVRRVVERWDLRVVGPPRKERPAAQVELLDRPHVPDGVVHVVEEDLPDPGPAARGLGAEVAEPARVRPPPRLPPPLLLVPPQP